MQTIEIIKPSAPLEMTATGMKIHRAPTLDEWLAFGDTLYHIHQQVQWAIGDWLNYGEEKFGALAEQAMDATRYSYEWIAQLKSLAKTYPPLFRGTKKPDGTPLPITTYRAVAAFPEPIRTEALKQAVQQGLNRDETRDVAMELSGKTRLPHWEKFTETETGEYQHIEGKFRIVVWRWIEENGT